VEEALNESVSLARFAGIDLGAEAVPDETTVLHFRHLLEAHDLGRRLVEAVATHLQEQGLKIAHGTIVDATIINAPSSTKNAAGERDSIRAKVEHVFAVIKQKFGFTKVRYKGLAKNTHRLFVTCALANLYMARRHLLCRPRP
jgi:IS5 family transposase